MVGPHHICIVYVATAGLQGHLMGSDEQEIVLLIYVIIDVMQNKVRHRKLLFRNPLLIDSVKSASTSSNISICILTDNGYVAIKISVTM